jgi:heme-degrading monooxygenase HmoA
MTFVLLHYKIRNYMEWKDAFDKTFSDMQTAGCKSFSLYRSTESLGASDPAELTLITEWRSLDDARKFNDSPERGKFRSESGVLGEPRVSYLHKVEQKDLSERKVA